YVCAVYISSGSSSIAQRAASRAARFPQVALVDTFTDEAYARSSIKLVGAPCSPLVSAALAVVEEALSLVDLSLTPHPAPHPRCGAVDMVAFMPLSDARASASDAALAACDSLAWQLAAQIGLLDVTVLTYGPRSGRSLLEARRASSFFDSTRAEAPREVQLLTPADAGPSTPSQRHGVCVVGAQPYVTNFNIQARRDS
ncbi:MAG: hypothetical protein SGPRY_004420, partial [Prymnesium sp.]